MTLSRVSKPGMAMSVKSIFAGICPKATTHSPNKSKSPSLPSAAPVTFSWCAVMNTTVDPTQTLRHALATFNPSLEIPESSNAEFLTAVVLIILIQFTTTYRHPLLPYLRLMLAVPTVNACLGYGLSGKHGPYLNRHTPMGMSLMAYYGIMKVVELSIVSFNNKADDWPKWVSKNKDKTGKRRIIPFQPTIVGRLLYSFDLLSVRGSSWYSDRIWDYAPTPIAEYKPSPRLQTFAYLVGAFTLQYLALDTLESIKYSRHWDTLNPHPITSLPTFIEQAVFALCICLGTILSITAPYILNTLSTMLLGAPPAAWPPLFDSPLSSCSLAEFWTHKWHALFRRSFDKLSSGILALVPTSRFGVHARLVKLLRAIIIFGLSALLHLFILNAVPIDDTHPHPSFWNEQAIKFFLLQPLGLLIELFIVFPSTELLPPRAKKEIRRMAAWCWLLWTGRYYGDVWIRRGMWGYRERFIVYSPVRWLLFGKWVV